MYSDVIPYAYTYETRFVVYEIQSKKTLHTILQIIKNRFFFVNQKQMKVYVF